MDLFSPMKVLYLFEICLGFFTSSSLSGGFLKIDFIAYLACFGCQVGNDGLLQLSIS